MGTSLYIHPEHPTEDSRGSASTRSHRKIKLYVAELISGSEFIDSKVVDLPPPIILLLAV